MKNQEGYILRISENVLIQMILNGLEAYSIQEGKNNCRKPLETVGLLWGHEIILSNKQILYSIELLSIETSAIRKESSVDPKRDSLKLKRDIVSSFWPQFDFLGDFHTHPYENCKEVVQYDGFNFSPDDYDDIEKKYKYWKKHNYRVGLVLTIAMLNRKSSREHRWISNNCIDFTLGNLRLWIKGYVAFEKNIKLRLTKDYDEDVTIDCPSLMGINWEYTVFGKLRRKGRKIVHEAGEI
jgi:hypothetical protein